MVQKAGCYAAWGPPGERGCRGRVKGLKGSVKEHSDGVVAKPDAAEVGALTVKHVSQWIAGIQNYWGESRKQGLGWALRG